MKCSDCGFVSSKFFYRCPYCGKIHESKDNIFRKSITIGNLFVVRLQTIIYILVANLFATSVLVDWYFSFKYGITLWAFIVFISIALFVSIAASNKKSLISIMERVDFFILSALLLACGTCRIEGVFDFRMYIPTFAIPVFMILATLISFILLFRKSSSKIRPLWTEFLLLTHLAVISVVFALFLVDKYCMVGNVEFAKLPFKWFSFMNEPQIIDSVADYSLVLNSPLFLIEELIIYAAFGAAVLYLLNYNIFLVGHIFRQVKGFYGKPRN